MLSGPATREGLMRAGGSVFKFCHPLIPSFAPSKPLYLLLPLPRMLPSLLVWLHSHLSPFKSSVSSEKPFMTSLDPNPLLQVLSALLSCLHHSYHFCPVYDLLVQWGGPRSKSHKAEIQKTVSVPLTTTCPST